MSAEMVVLEYVKTLAWPMVVMTAILLFRAQISAAIQRLNSSEINAAGVNLRLGFGDIRAAQKEIQISKQEIPSVPALDLERQREIDDAVEELAKSSTLERAISDREVGDGWSRITLAFIGLIDVVTTVSERAGVDLSGRHGTYPSAMRELKRLGVIDSGVVDAARRLERVYASQPSGLGEPEDAIVPFVDIYVSTADELARLIAKKVLTWQRSKRS